MKGAESGEILGARLLQLYIAADDADNVRLLLDRICQIARVCHSVV